MLSYTVLADPIYIGLIYIYVYIHRILTVYLLIYLAITLDIHRIYIHIYRYVRLWPTLQVTHLRLQIVGEGGTFDESRCFLGRQ